MRRVRWCCCLAALFACGTATAVAQSPGSSSSDSASAATEPNDAQDNEEYYDLLRLFIDTLDQVERNYVEDLSRRELMEAAIEGMVSKLDQHSDYIAPGDLAKFKTEVESEFGGIGIQISRRPGPLTVISPLVGSPAYRAGVSSGDVITHIEGESIEGLDPDEAIRRIKGPIGTGVRLRVRHPDDRGSEEFEIQRAVVRVETVVGNRRKPDDSWDFLIEKEQRIGYVRLTGFARATTDELRRAIRQLKQDGAKGLILDLRNNPGGLLSTAIQVSNMFVSEGRIVSTEGRNVQPKVWYARRRGTIGDLPMAVLVNRFSASASEIVAACLQDHERAIVVGERTFGKGSVQNIIEMEGGRSALKLTTAGYVRPSGKNIHRFPDHTQDDEWGVQPNEGFEVKVSREQFFRLRRQWDARSIVAGDNAPKPEDELEDPVLSRALAYLVKREDELTQEVATGTADE